MGQAPCPHNLCPCLIVLRVIPKDFCIFHNGSHQPFRQPVRNLHIPPICKIPLHRMHQNIRAPAGSLIIRQCKGQLRIHNRKPRTANIIFIPTLHPAFFLRQNRAVAHLAPCRRNGQNHANRQTCRSLPRMLIEIPYIPLICSSIANGLCRINHTPPANCKYKVHTFSFRKGNPLIHQ